MSRANANLVAIAVNACRSGYAVLPVEPGGKKPMCTLTPAARKKADVAAAREAQEAGRKRWTGVTHTCGFNHAITDPLEAGKVFRRLVELHPDLNIALEVGRSRMICVDTDTAKEVADFTALWAEQSGYPALAHVLPTVSSPGVVKRTDPGPDGSVTESWIHKDGGHYWFFLPDDHPGFADAVTASGLNMAGASVYFKDRVLLVPPSIRKEGPYTLLSDVGTAPAWLLDAVHLHVEGHAVRRAAQREKAHRPGVDPIDTWAADTTWASVLEPDGWTPAHKWDSCQCEVWTRPGSPASTKSATAHEPGCTMWDVEDDNGFLHIWTDNPPFEWMQDARSLSKLQYLALRDHDGDYSAAMSAEGIGRLGGVFTDPMELMGDDSSGGEGGAANPIEGPGDDGAATLGGSGAVALTDEAETFTTWLPVDLGPILDGTVVQPTATFMVRIDGNGLMYPGRVHWFQGEPESGKSWVLQLSVAQTLMNGGTALYLDFEQDAATVVSRLRLLGTSVDDIRRGFTYVQPEVSWAREHEHFTALLVPDYDIAVVDGVTDALGTGQASLNDNEEVARWMRQVPRRIARDTGAAVGCVDHVVKDKEGRGRYALGAQAKLAGVDGATYIVEPEEPLAPGLRGVLVIRLMKDRYGAVRSVCPPWRKSDRSQEAARVVIDATGKPDVLPWEVGVPEKSQDPGSLTAEEAKLMEEVSRALEDSKTKDGTYMRMSITQITDLVSKKKDRVSKALVDLHERVPPCVGTEKVMTKDGTKVRSILYWFERQFRALDLLMGDD